MKKNYLILKFSNVCNVNAFISKINKYCGEIVISLCIFNVCLAQIFMQVLKKIDWCRSVLTWISSKMYKKWLTKRIPKVRYKLWDFIFLIKHRIIFFFKIQPHYCSVCIQSDVIYHIQNLSHKIKPKSEVQEEAKRKHVNSSEVHRLNL